MKQFLVISLAAAALSVGASAQAGRQASSFVDKARVVDVEPVVRTVRVAYPRRECWDEELPQARRHHGDGAGGMILGGVIGGIAGHAVGRRVHKGRGKHAATVVGTLIGAAIGHDAASRGQEHYDDGPRYAERCRNYTDYTSEERVDGYRVTYRYKGEEFTTRLPYDPGKSLRVRVRVEAIAD